MKSYKQFISESNNYYQDDINVDITSTVIDILQDLIDEGLNIKCFTVGYITLKQSGVKYTENDISLSIMSNHDYDINYKVLDYEELIPYLERVINYIQSEDRVVDIKLQWRNKGELLREVEFKYRQGDIHNYLSSIPDNKYESIGMKFKLK